MPAEDNFFTNELYQYYLSQGKNLSEQVIQVLNKPEFELSDDEKKTFENFVLPARENIKHSLIACLKRPGVSEDEWREQLLFHSHTIIGQIATEGIEEKNKLHKTTIPSTAAVAPQSISRKADTPLSAPRTSRVSKTWKTVIGIAIGLIVAGGAIAGTLIALKDGERKEDSVVSEGEVALVYIKDGNIYYCEVDGNEIKHNDILVDELQNIDYLDVGTNGDTIVYTTESSSESSNGGGTFYVYTPSEGKIDAYHIDMNLFVYSPLLDGNNEIWFSANAGGPGSSVHKFLISDASATDITAGGLNDINIQKDEFLLTRHEYYEGGGSYDERYLTDSNGNVLQDLGSFYSESMEIMPEMWSYGGGYYVAKNRTTADGGYTEEILLLDKDFNPVETYSVPEEYRKVTNCDWDEATDSLVFSSEGAGLCFVNMKSKETVLPIDDGNITYARFIRRCDAKTYTKSKPELTDAERADIQSMIETWFTPSLNAAKGDYSDFDYRILWSMLSDGSPYKHGKTTDTEEMLYTSFAIMESEISPMNSYTVDSIEYDGEKAIARCICNWPAIDSVMDDYSYPERDTKVEFTLVKEKGEWKIYEVWYEPWEE